MAVSIALIDAGPLIALFDRTDNMHERVSQFLMGFRGRLFSTWPVVTEVAHFLTIKQQRNFLTWLRRGGVQLVDIAPTALDDFDTMLAKYADRPMDLADASLVWLGSKLRVSTIITLDRADFSIYRDNTGKPFLNLLSEY